MQAEPQLNAAFMPQLVSRLDSKVR